MGWLILWLTFGWVGMMGVIILCTASLNRRLDDIVMYLHETHRDKIK